MIFKKDINLNKDNQPSLIDILKKTVIKVS